MKEKIEELFKLSGGYTSLSYEHDGLPILSGTEAIEKFAKLVANECSNLCVAEYSTPDGFGVTTSDKRCSELIKKHFDTDSI